VLLESLKPAAERDSGIHIGLYRESTTEKDEAKDQDSVANPITLEQVDANISSNIEANKTESNRLDIIGDNDISGGLEQDCYGSWRRMLNGIAVTFTGTSLLFDALPYDLNANVFEFLRGMLILRLYHI
jgi:hypothetical protein